MPSILATLLELAIPPACVACRRPSTGAGVLCRECRTALPWLGSAVCLRCALPHGGRRGCQAAANGCDRAWAPLAYDGPVPAVVAALKEHGALDVAAFMAAQITATAPPGLLDGAVLVPVPGHPVRRRRRGVDHAARVALALGRRTGLDVRAVLRRRADGGRRQAGSGRAERLRDGRMRVEVRRGAIPAVVLLVDDVHTTGATLRACAAALREAGARDVRGVTYARTLP